MLHRKLFPLLLAVALLLTLCACGQGADSDSLSAPDSGVPHDSDLVVSQEEVAAVFNAAVDKLNTAGSYTMTGNVTSVAEVLPTEDADGELVTVQTPINCTYQDGKMLMISEGGDNPHTTYFDGTHYFISVPFGEDRLRFYVAANDYSDFDAAMYLKQIDAEMIFKPSLADNEAGGKDISFQIPFALYGSEALNGWLGEVVDESHASQNIQVNISIDKEGNPVSVFLSFSTTTQFFDDSIQQELAVSVVFSNFGSTVVSAPDDLERYEDWTVSGTPTESGEGFLEIPAEDLE